jgi:hypothetical protein
MHAGTQAMFVALIAMIIGVVFSTIGTASVFISIAGRIFIMGAFIIAVTAFLLFLKELYLGQGE